MIQDNFVERQIGFNYQNSCYSEISTSCFFKLPVMNCEHNSLKYYYATYLCPSW